MDRISCVPGQPHTHSTFTSVASLDSLNNLWDQRHRLSWVPFHKVGSERLGDLPQLHSNKGDPQLNQESSVKIKALSSRWHRYMVAIAHALKKLLSFILCNVQAQPVTLTGNHGLLQSCQASKKFHPVSLSQGKRKTRGFEKDICGSIGTEPKSLFLLLLLLFFTKIYCLFTKKHAKLQTKQIKL